MKEDAEHPLTRREEERSHGVDVEHRGDGVGTDLSGPLAPGAGPVRHKVKGCIIKNLTHSGAKPTRFDALRWLSYGRAKYANFLRHASSSCVYAFWFVSDACEHAWDLEDFEASRFLALASFFLAFSMPYLFQIRDA